MGRDILTYIHFSFLGQPVLKYGLTKNLKHKMDKKHENHTKFHNLNGVDDILENNNPVEPDAVVDPTDIEVDDKISMLENTLQPKPTWQIKIMTQITYYVHFTFFTFYLLLYHTAWTNLATCETFNKLETDPEALGCRLVTQLATHCLNRSSYISQLTRTQAITQTIMKYLSRLPFEEGESSTS